MPDEKAERRRRVAAIKKGATSANAGRSYLLRGLWACRLAAGLTQRQLAEMIGGNAATVRELERGRRGAYPRTLVRLCEALGVAPEDLLCGDERER
jgi:DNA-binding Xre family transcriptional regulator